MLNFANFDRHARIEILTILVVGFSLWLTYLELAPPRVESTTELLARRADFVELTGDRNGFIDALNAHEPTYNNDTDRPVQLDLRERFRTRDTIISEIEKTAATSGQPGNCRSIATAVFEFVSRNRRHSYPLLWGNMLHSPASFFTTYGAGFCDDAATMMVEISRWFGLPARSVWVGELPSGKGIHVISEIYCDGEWGIYDPDLSEVIRHPDGRPLTFEELAALAEQKKLKWADSSIVRMHVQAAEDFDASRSGERGDPWGVLLPREKRFYFNSPFFITSDGRFPEQRAWHSRAEVLQHYGESTYNFARVIPLKAAIKPSVVYVDDYFPIVAAFIRTKARQLPEGSITLIGSPIDKAMEISGLENFKYGDHLYIDLTPTLLHLHPSPSYSLRLGNLVIGEHDAELITVHLYSRFGVHPTLKMPFEQTMTRD